LLVSPDEEVAMTDSDGLETASPLIMARSPAAAVAEQLALAPEGSCMLTLDQAVIRVRVRCATSSTSVRLLVAGAGGKVRK
jgi:hypothetical protein